MAKDYEARRLRSRERRQRNPPQLPAFGKHLKRFHAAPQQQTETIGDLSRIVAMFDRAKEHLKYPAIVLDGFRVTVAGETAREPTSLTVTSIDKGTDGHHTWYGRVTKAGTYEPSRIAPPAIATKLRAFAADPMREAGAYGRQHGTCCFCRLPLRAKRSTTVGYGPVCADHFGLPWGTREGHPVIGTKAIAAEIVRNR